MSLNLAKALLCSLFLWMCSACSETPPSQSAPTINITTEPASQVTGPYQLTIDATDSIDEDGDNLVFLWTLNGEEYSNESVFLSELEVGQHQIIVTVSDGENSSEQLFDITVVSKGSEQDLTVITQACPERVIYGARQLRLLTAQEYQNTLEDLVGIDFSVLHRLPTDDKIEDFYNNVSIVPNQSHINAYLTIADDVSNWAKLNDFAGLASCDTSLVTCQETFVREFGAKAFRRPLKENEVTDMLSLLGDTRLMNSENQTGSCANPAWGGAGIEESVALADGDLRCDILIEVIALAMQCDMLRVASLSVDRTDVIPTVDINVHDSAHEESPIRANAGRAWLNSKIVRLMDQLENAADSDGNSLLHNSIIHHVSDYGNGKLHSNIRAPLFLAGGGKGKLRTGVNFDGTGLSYFDVFDTVADVAGVINEPDYPMYGNGVIQSLKL